jgi:hypothetical protein
MNNYWVVGIIAGIIIVIIGVVEYVGKISAVHAIAILTVIVGVSVALGGIGSRRAGPLG